MKYLGLNLDGFMSKDNIYKQNKNAIGFMIFPIITLMIYLVDLALAGSALSDWIRRLYEGMGFLSGDRPYNFYNFEYNRTIFSLTIAMAPICILHWYYCANVSRFNYNSGLRGCIEITLAVVGFFLMWLFIFFFPLPLEDAPTQKTLELRRLQKNPFVFTALVYVMFIVFMVWGLCIRYLCHYRKNKSNGSY